MSFPKWLRFIAVTIWWTLIVGTILTLAGLIFGCTPLAINFPGGKVWSGVNVSNAGKALPHAQDTVAWKEIKKDGYNFVRYLWWWDGLEPELGAWDTLYLAQIVRDAQGIRDANLGILLDGHQDLYCTTFTGNGMPSWTVPKSCPKFEGRKEPWVLTYTDPAVSCAWSGFWDDSGAVQRRYIAALLDVVSAIDTIKGIQWVGIDVLNEPWHGTKDLGAVNAKMRKFYLDAIDRVTTRFSHVPVFVEPWMWTSSLPVVGPENIKGARGYAPHLYDPLVESGRGTSGKRWIKVALSRKIMEAHKVVAGGVPLIVSEFGGPTNNVDGFRLVRNSVDEMEAKGISWAVWSWDTQRANNYGMLGDSAHQRSDIGTMLAERIKVRRIGGEGSWGYTSRDSWRVSWRSGGAIDTTQFWCPPAWRDAVLLSEYPTTVDTLENGARVFTVSRVPDNVRAEVLIKLP